MVGAEGGVWLLSETLLEASLCRCQVQEYPPVCQYTRLDLRPYTSVKSCVSVSFAHMLFYLLHMSVVCNIWCLHMCWSEKRFQLKSVSCFFGLFFFGF